MPTRRFSPTRHLTAGTLALAAAAAVFLAGAGPAEAKPPAVGTVAALDIERFSGTWYELARLPNDVQNACVGDVSAWYGRRDDGGLTVINRCRRGDGSIEQAAGVVRSQAGAVGPAKLEVSFLPDWLRWTPLGWDDYWVVALDDAYRLAVVSDRGRRHLWILAREPQIKTSTYRALVDELRERGFPVHRLMRTLHDPALSTALPPEALQSALR